MDLVCWIVILLWDFWADYHKVEWDWVVQRKDISYLTRKPFHLMLKLAKYLPYKSEALSWAAVFFLSVTLVNSQLGWELREGYFSWHFLRSMSVTFASGVGYYKNWGFFPVQYQIMKSWEAELGIFPLMLKLQWQAEAVFR